MSRKSDIPIFCLLALTATNSLCASAGNVQQDLAGLTRAVQAAPASDLAHYKLANALLSSGQKDAAMLEYRKAYMISQTPQLMENCQKVLLYYRVPLPDIRNESLQLRMARAKLPESTFGSLDNFLALAAKDSDKFHGRMDSNPEGVTQYKQCPETVGALGDSWHKWNEDFRINFEYRLKKRLATFGVPAIYGQTKMIFSVDQSGHLRGRVLQSNLPTLLWDCMLDATRLMDGTPYLNFPAGTQVTGFNFTMGWAYPDPPPAVQERVAAIMRSNRTSATMSQPIGLNAVPVGLNNTQTAAQMNSVNSKVLPAQGLRGEALGLPGQQSQANGQLLPNVDAEVSGKVVPKPKQEELKANAGTL